MNGQLMRITLSICLLLSVVVSCKKTDDAVTAAPSLNCSSTALSPSAFTSSGTAQSTTLTVGLSNAIAGSVTFAIASSSSDFTPATYTTTITAGQSTVAIPLAFNGTSSATSETITVSTSAYASGSCTAIATITSGSSSTTATTGTTGSVTAVVAAANAFLATLSTTQQASVIVALNLANAKKWSNLPCGLSCRQGLAFSSLSATQLAAAKAVIQVASGTVVNEGYSEFSQINAADDVLSTTGGSGYSSGFYIIAFLGTPSTTGKWMLQFGGHHYAQSVTYDAGSVVSTTPSHQGIEPKSWTSGGVTYAPLAQEASSMADMLASFTAAELASAKISSTFSDVTMVPGSTTNTFPTTKLGIKVSSLSTTAQAKVLAAMAPWLTDLDDASAAAFTRIYTNELANTYVTYASNTSGTSGNASSFFTTNTDYVRIDGPSVWIEFICQTGVVYRNEIHYHSVYRDHTRDYIGL